MGFSSSSLTTVILVTSLGIASGAAHADVDSGAPNAPDTNPIPAEPSPAEDSRPGGIQSLGTAPSPTTLSPPSRPSPRKRPTGFSVGLLPFTGLIGGVDGREAALGLSFHFAWQLSRRFAVGLDWLGASPANDIARSPDYFAGSIGLAARYWARPQVWLEGGAGAGGVDVSDKSGETSGRRSGGGALFAAAGFEAIHRATFTIDIGVRGQSIITDDDQIGVVLLGIGFRRLWPSNR